jgi:hypothetical protein
MQQCTWTLYNVKTVTVDARDSESSTPTVEQFSINAGVDGLGIISNLQGNDYVEYASDTG